MVDRDIPADAARKRVECASGLKRLGGVHFEKNAWFIYHENQYGDLRFWGGLEKAFEVSGKSYWGALIGLGACPRSLFPRVCGAPISRKKQLSPDAILERLINISLLEEVEDGKSGEQWIQLKPYCYGVAAPSSEIVSRYIHTHMPIPVC